MSSFVIKKQTKYESLKPLISKIVLRDSSILIDFTKVKENSVEDIDVFELISNLCDRDQINNIKAMSFS